VFERLRMFDVSWEMVSYFWDRSPWIVHASWDPYTVRKIFKKTAG
jgi:hypothetical protein